MKVSPFVRKLILVFGDICCIYFANSLAIMPILGSSEYKFNFEFLSILILLMFFMFNVYGLFSLVRKRLTDIFLNLLVAILNIYIICIAITYLINELDYSSMTILISAILSFVLLGVWQYVCHKWEWNNFPKHHGVLFAKDNEKKILENKLSKTYGLENVLQDVSHGLNDNLWPKKIDENYYVFIGSSLDIKEKEAILCYARSKKKQIFLVPTLYELACKNTGLLLVDDVPMQRVTRLLLTDEQRTLKRCIDIIIAILSIILLLPIMIVTAIIIKVSSKGPIIYSQERVGLYGKTFFVHKFRSMKQDAEAKCGPILAAEDDNRITKFGRFIRATRLDELPQLFNVLKGEMSIVGPRPERPFFVEKFVAQKPEYDYRHNVKPGITGLAQIAGKYNTNSYDKLIYDLLYIQDVGVKTDLMIMLQTFKVLLTKSSTEGVQNSK